MKTENYIVKRVVVEYYQVQAVSKADAIIEAGRKGDPYSVNIKTETAKKLKP